MKIQDTNTLAQTAIINHKDLIFALDKAAKVTSKKYLEPIEANTAFYNKDRYIEIKSTDLDIELTSRIENAGNELGNLTLPTHKLQKLIKKAKSNGLITVQNGQESATIGVGNMSISMDTLPYDEFPKFPEPKQKWNTIVYEASDLLTILQRCLPCISTEETRYYLNGVAIDLTQLDHNDGDISFVSTDGHKLARTIKKPLHSEFEGDSLAAYIVPTKTIKLVIDILKHKQGPKGEIEISINDSHVIFRLGNDVLKSKLIDGTYPDYHRVIPAMPTKKAEFDRKELIDAVKALSEISSQRGRAIAMELSTNGATLTVNNPDIGEAKISLNCDFSDSFSGGGEIDDIKIGYNSSYLLDLLPLIEGDAVAFEFDNSGGPALIGNGDEKFTFVLMPMRV